MFLSINTINYILEIIIKYVEVLIYTVALLIILFGLTSSILTIFKRDNLEPTNHKYQSYFPELNLTYSRLQLGESLTVAMTFIVAVEILKSYYINTNQQLIRIGAILLIRQFITYFLDKERFDYYHATNLS